MDLGGAEWPHPFGGHMSWNVCVWAAYNGVLKNGDSFPNDPIYNEEFDDYDSAHDKAERILEHGIKVRCRDAEHWFASGGIDRIRLGQGCAGCRGCKECPEWEEV